MFLWGDEFEAATFPMKLLAISLLFMPANKFLGYMLFGLNKQVWSMGCTVMGAVFNVAANYWLIPILGLSAAAITTVATEFLVLALEAVCLQKAAKERGIL